MRHSLLLCILLASVGSACGKVEVATSPVRSVSGYVLVTALDPNTGSPLSPSGLTVTAYNPNTVLLSSTPQALDSMELEADCVLALGCPYRFPALDFSRLTIGLLTGVAPVQGNDTVWTPAYTWVADTNTTRAALDGNYAVPNTRSYALSNSALQRLQAITGIDSGTLLARGALVGVVQGAAGEAGGTAVEPPALAGATVNTDAATLVDIVYANDTLDGHNSAAKTGAHGLFVAVAKNPSPVVNVWRVIAPAGDTVHRWPQSALAGTLPGRITLLVLPASPE